MPEQIEFTTKSIREKTNNFVPQVGIILGTGLGMYPKGFSRHWFGKWINTSVSHNQHHQYFKGNYSLYFTFWDRMMGTLRNDYEQRFEEVVAKKA